MEGKMGEKKARQLFTAGAKALFPSFMQVWLVPLALFTVLTFSFPSPRG